ncbi:LacI family DNA-binding transcriptional regulator [Kibdelosporangium persicum]|uniref:ABC transporter sugar-binding protein/LacI transcriptional regulator n=1 Tax=Kibdelosporangium persicum TaxID=2698649 RepID=A0ABX2F6D2_9PSEU|nr:LacI family DNA-binding transcriptional regulator [Kibdelosporangium persicum]NRN66926.1 ABC transporter sugar-binding protein/LacI transcriptional regulator [Kibdelosporangium persicum]
MNIGEIARRAGVSRSTVSYALSGKRPVAAATARRINEVIAELGYRPNASARALAEGRTRTLALVIPPASRRLTNVQLDFVATVVEAAAAHDLDVLLSPSGGDHDRSFERIVTGRRVDGVIMMEILLDDPRVTRLRQNELPFVTIGHVEHPGGSWWVDVDYAALVRRCVHHLADLAHRHVVLINRSAELVAAGYGPAVRSTAGFQEAAEQRGLSAHVVCCADEPAAGLACFEQIRARRPEVTAVVTINEAALPGLQRALHRAGLVVPRDFSITGVIADRLAEDFHPPLTAADVPAEEMARLAVDLLVERIADPAADPRHALLDPVISLRSSTGARPAR